MRINIHVPDSHVASTLATKRNLGDMPLPLVRLSPSNELVLIELQGSLEMDDADQQGGQLLGKLEFHPGREDRPTLLISHHRLEGRIVSLAKPLAVLETKKRGPKAGLLASESHEKKTSGSAMNLVDINRAYGGEGTSQKNKRTAEDIPSSPSRFDRELRQSSPTSRDLPEEIGSQSPSLARKRARVNSLIGQVVSQNPPTSSPVPPPRAMGSEIDYSSPIADPKRHVRNSKSSMGSTGSEGLEENNNDEDFFMREETATSLEVVCIIRKKILFTKRPEPIVRLDDENAQKAQAAST